MQGRSRARPALSTSALPPVKCVRCAQGPLLPWQQGPGVCRQLSPGNALGTSQMLQGQQGQGWNAEWCPGEAEGADPPQARSLSPCREMPLLPLQNPRDFNPFWDVKANVNPSNRNYSQEIPIMYSRALHPNSFKMFPSDFDLFFKTCLQLKKINNCVCI